jgi:flagellum-specific peptidoglycan hydrolase FlgJ
MGIAILIFLLLIAGGLPSQALRLQLTTDNYNVRLLQKKNGILHNAIDYDRNGRSLYLGIGSEIEIPDVYVIRDANNNLDLRATLANWKLYGVTSGVEAPAELSFQGLFADDTKPATAYPVYISKSRGTRSEFNKNTKYYMDLSYLVDAPDRYREVGSREQSASAPSETREKNWLTTHKQQSNLQCVSATTSTNVCSSLEPQFSDMMGNNADYFRQLGRRNGRQKIREYIQYITPIAQYAEALTGFPASVLIAQSIVETGGGSSAQFRNNNGLFGFSCRRKKKSNYNYWQQSYSISGVNLGFRASCSSPRPKSEGGHYYVFASKEESVWAFVYNYLYSSNSRRYAGVRNLVTKAKEQSLSGVADWKKVVGNISGYAANDRKYQAALTGMIKSYNLDQLDFSGNTCQQCLAKNNFQNMLVSTREVASFGDPQVIQVPAKQHPTLITTKPAVPVFRDAWTR